MCKKFSSIVYEMYIYMLCMYTFISIIYPYTHRKMNKCGEMLGKPIGMGFSTFFVVGSRNKNPTPSVKARR